MIAHQRAKCTDFENWLERARHFMTDTKWSDEESELRLDRAILETLQRLQDDGK